MQQVVTLTGLETKSGAGDKGPWTLSTFKDAGGNKFQTFDGALAGLAQSLLGQQVTVTYEVETRSYKDRNGVDRVANNNVLQAIAAGAQAGVSTEAPLPSHTGPQQQTSTSPAWSSNGGGADYSSLNRVRAGELANGTVAAAGIKINDPSQLELFANMWLRYIESGTFTESGSSSQPAGDPVQY